MGIATFRLLVTLMILGIYITIMSWVSPHNANPHGRATKWFSSANT